MHSMEPISPYRNFLPGKKIQIAIGVIVLGVLAYFFIPRIITFLKNNKTDPASNKGLLVTALSGDPTTRDTDGDGVSDWQEIAVGLDPRKPETNPGTPDAQKFETFKSTLGYDLFTQAESNTTDTDKISLALSNEITHNLQNSTATEVSISNVTATELLNYIEARKSKITLLSLKDINVVENTLETNTAYSNKMNEILKDDVGTKNFASDLNAYIEGAGSQQAIDTNLSYIEKTLTALKTVPVPSGATTLHLEISNSVQGVYEIIKGIDVANSDEFVKLSTVTLLQDYIIRLATSAGKLPIYFSVALDEAGYVQ